MRIVRGAYRGVGQGLDEAFVVIPKDMRFNPGAKSCRIAGGVGGGRVRLWHDWPRTKKESRAQYIERLKRIAMRLPKSFIDNSIADMQRRCQRLYASQGGHFEEGGRSGRVA